jgi:hypothetical protein
MLEQVVVTVGKQREQDHLRLLVTRLHKEGPESIGFRVAGELLEMPAIAANQLLNAPAFAGVVNEGKLRVKYLGWAVAKPLCKVIQRDALAIDPDRGSTAFALQHDHPILGFEFQSELKAWWFLEIAADEDLDNGLDEVRFSAAIAADDGVDQRGLREVDVARTNVLVALNLETPKFHRFFLSKRS